MRRLSVREKSIFVICIALVSFYMLYNFLFLPLKDQSEMVDAQIEAKQRKLKRNERTLNKAKLVKSKIDQYKEDFKQDGSNEKVMSGMLLEIEEVASDLNLKISDLKPKKVKENEFYNHFSLSLTIRSEFVDIIEFIYNLQSEPHNFNVEIVRFDKAAKRKVSELKTFLEVSKPLIP